MKRTKLKDRELPTYTKGEEIFNMTTHIVGAVLGLVATILCIIFAATHGNGCGVVSGIIYGTSMILLYTTSSIYHGLSPKRTSKKVFQILDHCVIFVLIAGSYTPFALCTIREHDPLWGWLIFGFIWTIAIIGIVLNAIDLKKFRIFSMIAYIVMGWCIVIKMSLLNEILSPMALILLVLGGILYTVGAIFYGFGKKIKYMHSIFHLLIVLASLLQFLCILLYVM